MFKCEKHPQRKRPTTCPDCKRELEERGQTIIEVKSISEEVKNDIVNTTITEITNEKIVEDLNEIEFNKFKDNVETYIEERFKKLKYDIMNLCNIKYEYEYIPEKDFRVSMIDKKARDGWRYKEIFDASVAKIYGLKEPVAVFERIKRDESKK